MLPLFLAVNPTILVFLAIGHGAISVLCLRLGFCSTSLNLLNVEAFIVTLLKSSFDGDADHLLITNSLLLHPSLGVLSGGLSDGLKWFVLVILRLLVQTAWFYPTDTSRALWNLAILCAGFGLIATLEGRNLERIKALQLHNEELRESETRALRSTQVKSEFLSRMSHEIRTPLNGCIGMLQLVEGAKLPQEQQEYVNAARESAESLLELVTSMLDFTRLETGRLRLSPQLFCVPATVERVVCAMMRCAEEKGIALVCRVDTGAPLLAHGDPGRFRQLLLNLVSNAIRFTKRGQVVVRLSRCRVPPSPQLPRVAEAVVVSASEEEQPAGRGTSKRDDSWLRVSVTDTGVGISPQQLPTIGSAFTQGHGGSGDNSNNNSGVTHRNYDGVGLGLAICHQLASLMGGRLLVRSALGRGSQFSLCCPTSVNQVPSMAVDSARTDTSLCRGWEQPPSHRGSATAAPAADVAVACVCTNAATCNALSSLARRQQWLWESCGLSDPPPDAAEEGEEPESTAGWAPPPSLAYSTELCAAALVRLVVRWDSQQAPMDAASSPPAARCRRLVFVSAPLLVHPNIRQLCQQLDELAATRVVLLRSSLDCAPPDNNGTHSPHITTTRPDCEESDNSNVHLSTELSKLRVVGASARKPYYSPPAPRKWPSPDRGGDGTDHNSTSFPLFPYLMLPLTLCKMRSFVEDCESAIENTPVPLPPLQEQQKFTAAAPLPDDAAASVAHPYHVALPPYSSPPHSLVSSPFTVESSASSAGALPPLPGFFASTGAPSPPPSSNNPTAAVLPALLSVQHARFERLPVLQPQSQPHHQQQQQQQQQQQRQSAATSAEGARNDDLSRPDSKVEANPTASDLGNSSRHCLHRSRQLVTVSPLEVGSLVPFAGALALPLAAATAEDEPAAAGEEGTKVGEARQKRRAAALPLLSDTQGTPGPAAGMLSRRERLRRARALRTHTRRATPRSSKQGARGAPRSSKSSQVPPKHWFLVVDDNPVNRAVCARMLRRLGYGVQLATCGQEAVDAALLSLHAPPLTGSSCTAPGAAPAAAAEGEGDAVAGPTATRRFAGVFMDIHMPGALDGTQASRRIREVEKERRAAAAARGGDGASVPPLPIAALTADITPLQQRRCRAAGMHPFLSKPYTLDTLRHTAAHMIASAGDEPNAQARSSTVE